MYRFKTSHILLLILVLACSKAPHKDQAVGDKKFIVKANGGLNIRSKPDKTGSVLGKIPKYEIVYGSLVAGSIEPRDEISKSWYKITYKAKSGYINGAFIDYIAHESPNSAKDTHIYITTWNHADLHDYMQPYTMYILNSDKLLFTHKGSDFGNITWQSSSIARFSESSGDDGYNSYNLFEVNVVLETVKNIFSHQSVDIDPEDCKPRHNCTCRSEIIRTKGKSYLFATDSELPEGGYLTIFMGNAERDFDNCSYFNRQKEIFSRRKYTSYEIEDSLDPKGMFTIDNIQYEIDTKQNTVIARQ